MFASLSRAFSGAPTPAKAERLCREWFANLCANLESKAGDDPAIALLKDADFLAGFFNVVSATCIEVFKESNKKKQHLALRHFIVDFYERAHRARHYLSKSDNERKILSERFFAPNSKDEADQQCVINSQLFNVAALVFRSLGGRYFDDYTKGDWFAVMSFSGRRLIEYQMDTAIQRAQGSGVLPLFEAALTTFEQRYKEVAAVVFSGGNYNVDPAEFEDAPPEPKKEAPREPAKKAAVYADELDKLVDVMAKRALATAEGKYYSHEEFVPKSLYRCAAIDMACIWLAIASRLNDAAKAKGYVEQVMGRAYERSGVDTERHEGFRQCFDEAEVLASSIIEKGNLDGAWFADFIVVAFAYVYDRDLSSSPAKAEKQRALGASAFGMGAHVWPLFADVVNCLGDNVERTWLGRDDPATDFPS